MTAQRVTFCADVPLSRFGLVLRNKLADRSDIGWRRKSRYLSDPVSREIA